MRALVASLACALLLALPAWAQTVAPQQAQAEDAQQRLQGVRAELRAVAAERRQLEGQRGDASRQLRSADEAVGSTQRALAQTQDEMSNADQQLAQLQAERARHVGDLSTRRAELLRLLRAAQAGADAAPLKALLAQDRVQDAERALILQGYLQRAQVARIRTLAAEISRMQTLETQIAQQRGMLDRARQAQASQVVQAQSARQDRAAVLATLDRQYRDKASRERALGQDAKALQNLLAQLRAADRKSVV